jgi:type IV secretory pathway VirB10-like protein
MNNMLRRGTRVANKWRLEGIEMRRVKTGWIAAAAVVVGGVLLVGCQKGDDRTQALERRIEQLEKQATPEPSASPSVVDVSPGAQAYAPIYPDAAPVITAESRSAMRSSVARKAPHRDTAAAPSRSRDTSPSAGSAAPADRTEPASERPRPEPVERIGEGEARGTDGHEVDDLDREDRESGPRRVSTTREAESVTIPAGAQLALRLETAVSSTTSHAGDRVVARVERATSNDGNVLLPGGTVLEGRVTEANESGRVSGRARVTVAFDRIVIRGRSHPLEATTISAVAPDTHERDAKVIGGGAVAGAIIGGITGGRGGAAKGAVIGAGAGTTAVLVTKGKEVELPAGSRWVVRVRNAVRI